MILSSCHDYSLNNDCHCCCHCHCHYMQRIYVYFILSCLVLPWCELTGITTVIIGMTLYELVSHYIIISYLMFFYFISSADLISILFYSILFYSTLFQIDSIWFSFIQFYWIRFTILFSIVSHINRREENQIESNRFEIK